MDLTKNKIVIMICSKLYTFKSSYKISEFFNDDNNIKDIEGLTPEILYILTRPHLIQRILKLKKGDEQPHLIKQTTRDKYLNIKNFMMFKV